jgi:alpha-D-xyloside xylohydrolase
MREGGFPCDVLHLDAGWFAKDWICEWAFSKERFPDPEGFMREQGYRITLWRRPRSARGTSCLKATIAHSSFRLYSSRRVLLFWY